MKRAIVIFAIAWFVALGSGGLEYAHNLEHAREDARLAHRDQHSPVHDDSNCPIHGQLHQPLISAPLPAPVLCMGPLISIDAPIVTERVGVRILPRIDCRGPPGLV